LTTNIGRIGGFERDFSKVFHDKLKAFVQKFEKRFEEFDALFTRNRIFMDRTIGAGPISAEKALAYSFTGPNLRAAGVDYDVRMKILSLTFQSDQEVIRMIVLWFVKRKFVKVLELLNKRWKMFQKAITMRMFQSFICLQKEKHIQAWKR